jgi:hypothetical protein
MLHVSLLLFQSALQWDDAATPSGHTTSQGASWAWAPNCCMPWGACHRATPTWPHAQDVFPEHCAAGKCTLTIQGIVHCCSCGECYPFPTFSNPSTSRCAHMHCVTFRTQIHTDCARFESTGRRGLSAVPKVSFISCLLPQVPEPDASLWLQLGSSSSQQLPPCPPRRLGRLSSGVTSPTSQPRIMTRGTELEGCKAVGSNCADNTSPGALMLRRPLLVTRQSLIGRCDTGAQQLDE